MIEYTNSAINAVIDDVIHVEKHRDLLKRRLIDGITYEKLAEEFDMSVRQVKNIIYKQQEKVLKYFM